MVEDQIANEQLNNDGKITRIRSRMIHLPLKARGRSSTPIPKLHQIVVLYCSEWIGSSTK